MTDCISSLLTPVKTTFMVRCLHSYLVHAHTVYLQLEGLCLAQAGGVDRRTGVVGRLLQAEAAQLKLRTALSLQHLTTPAPHTFLSTTLYRDCLTRSGLKSSKILFFFLLSYLTSRDDQHLLAQAFYSKRSHHKLNACTRKEHNR